MASRPDDPLVLAIALAQAHEQGDNAAYSQIIVNNSAMDLIRGLIDMNRLTIMATEPETGRDVAAVLDRLWQVNAASDEGDVS